VAGIKIAVSGARGFIGTALCRSLEDAGYDVLPLVRDKAKGHTGIFYDYHTDYIDQGLLSECGALIHLAGKNIMLGLWTKGFRQELYDSRVKSTRFLAQTLAKLDNGPKILLNASAIGIYGDQRDLKVDEESYHGTDFLAQLCIDWERATLSAKSAGIRVVNMRFGHVLGPGGGMLKVLTPIFKLGLGGPFGSGKQYFSYVMRDELMQQIRFLLEKHDIAGPVNMVAFEPTTNEDFALAFAKMFHHKPFLRTPAFLFKLLGEQGRILIGSQRVYPKILLDHHYDFANHSDLEAVLHRVCASSPF
jgi:uncharacterized protein